jgi:hypothetical protein
MATARTTQAHEKRVKKIAEDAASAIAAESPFEEEVVVVVEESPVGASAPTRRQGAQVARESVDSMAGVMAQTQQFMADSISRWIDMTSRPGGGSPISLDAWFGQLDPRRLTEETFRFAEELLASQKQFALRLADVLTPAATA